MCRRLLLAVLLVPASVSGQTLNQAARPVQRLPPLTTPAPVPNVFPPGTELRYGGTPNSMPFVVSPPGIGSSFAGPVNATPFSTSPSANWPPDSALPDGRDSVRGGVGSIVPNLSR
jgi:hypothetical protein